MDSCIIQPKTAKEFYKMMSKLQRAVVYGGNEEINKVALENKKVDMLVNPEINGGDKMDSRNSGLNDALCKIASKHNIKIGLDIDYLLNLNDEEKILKLGKIMQNAMLCRKYNVKMVIFDKNGRNEKDLKGFGLCLGMKPGFEVVRC